MARKILVFAAVLALFIGFSSSKAVGQPCVGNGDINRDGQVLTVSDFSEMVRILAAEAPAPDSFFQADLNADCNVDSTDLRLFENYFIYGPSGIPGYPNATCCNPAVTLLCSASKGDMNADGSLTSADVVLILNCTFLGEGNCSICFADVNCDGMLMAAVVVGELNRVFLGLIEPPWCGT